MLKKRLVYDTTFYSGLVAQPYIEREGGDMHFSIKNLEQAFLRQSAASGTFAEAQEAKVGAGKEATAFATELFGTLVDGEGVSSIETPAGWAKGCFDTLEAQTEWRQLQRLCEHRKEIAAMTTAGLLNELAPLLAQVRKQEKEKENGNGNGEGNGEGEGEKPNESGAERELNEKIKQVVQGAKKQAQDAQDAYGALAGTGMHEQQKSDGDCRAKQQILKDISTSPHFKKMMDLVGRMQNVMKAKMALTEEKQVLLADIEYGDDLRRLSTLEFANLPMPETETLFLKRYAERKLAIRKASGHSNKGRGDMIIMLDESGSMEGTRLHLACAFAVAMVQLSIKEKRKAVVMGFNGGVTYIMKFDGLKGFLVNRRNFREKPQPAGQLISQILNRHASGGTCFGRVMSKALDMLQDMPDGDLVMVTDAYDQMPHPVVGRCETLKRTKGVRTSALFINEYFAHDKDMVTGHENWADQIWRCDTNPETLLDSLTSMAVEAIK